MRANKLSGFTLVELSIVLVIIGLLIGGILIGQTLIGSAKINAQIKQIQQYDIALNNFKTKYKQIPGDCSICDHRDSSNAAAPAGNNNGKLEGTGNTIPPNVYYYEPVFYFTDLYRMGALNEIVAHTPPSGSYNIGKGQEFPLAKIGIGGVVPTGNDFKNIFYAFTYRDSTSSSNDYTYTTRMSEGNFSPEQLAAYDSKIDDGLPNTGDVVAVRATLAASTSYLPFGLETDNSANCVYNAKYNVTLSATNLCRPLIKADLK